MIYDGEDTLESGDRLVHGEQGEVSWARDGRS